MSLQKIFLGVLLLVLSSFLAIKTLSGHQATPTPDLNSLSEADLKALTIRFERTHCYGSCPSYTLTIHGNGLVQYEGKDNVQTKGAKEGKMEATAIKALLVEFAKAKFLSMPNYLLEKCTCRRCTDMPSAFTEIVVSGVTHRVKHDYGCGCAPKELFTLESAIDKGAKVEQWTGDVSKQGVFGTTCW